MSFSDAQIAAIVKTGELSDPAAEEYLTKVLVERRDKIGNYWFSRINPIDKFESEITKDFLLLSFMDLGIKGKLFDPQHTQYQYSAWVEGGKPIAKNQVTTRQEIKVSLTDRVKPDRDPMVIGFEIITKRKHRSVSETKVQIYVALEKNGPRVVGIKREE